jgi:hypothetical protein
MTKNVAYFGGTIYGRVTLEDGHREDHQVVRELWFDKDFDGRWLVGVTNTAGEDKTGAIVVRDATIGAFIEMLGNLIIGPEQFADEPVLSGPGPDA